MAWTNYRNAVGLFGHVDAEFVRSASRFSPGGTAELVIRFYPWWQHPQYVSARDRGEHWGFSSVEAGKRDVTVRAIEPWAVRLSRTWEVLDCGFEEQHPLLWDFAERATVYANKSFERQAFFDGLMQLGLPNVSERDLRTHIHLPDPSKVPMGLMMPAQLYEPVLTVCRQLGVPTFSPGSPSIPKPSVVFLIGGDDYIIADDFEVDVPEFVHEPGWFQPAGRSE